MVLDLHGDLIPRFFLIQRNQSPLELIMAIMMEALLMTMWVVPPWNLEFQSALVPGKWTASAIETTTRRSANLTEVTAASTLARKIVRKSLQTARTIWMHFKPKEGTSVYVSTNVASLAMTAMPLKRTVIIATRVMLFVTGILVSAFKALQRIHTMSLSTC